MTPPRCSTTTRRSSRAAGLKPEKTTFNSNGQTGGTVSGKSEDGKREVSVIVSTTTEGTQALVSFQEKK